MGPILAPLLPKNPKKGHAYKDHKPILNGMIWRQQTGAPWRDSPERYGSWPTCHDRFTRWSRSGVWAEMLAALQLQADAEGKIDWEGVAVDSTHVKAHRSALGTRKEPAKLEKGSARRRVAGDQPRGTHHQNLRPDGQEVSTP